jgi:hypothetical protein
MIILGLDKTGCFDIGIRILRMGLSVNSKQEINR